MRVITSLLATLPCPCCGALGRRRVAIRTERGFMWGALPDGSHVGRVMECEACWLRRARALSAAREGLRASGELGSLGAGREDSWLGVPIRRTQAEFEGAVQSALLRLPSGMLPPEADLDLGTVLVHVERGRVRVLEEALEPVEV